MVNNMVTCDECNGWLNPALAVDAAVQRGEEILLIQRKFPPMAGYWALACGFVERDEDPLVAVLRELEEETGLIGSNPELLMVMGDPKRDPRKHIMPVGRPGLAGAGGVSRQSQPRALRWLERNRTLLRPLGAATSSAAVRHRWRGGEAQRPASSR